MQIVRLMGGLANQLMQYVYGRYLEYRINEPVYYDDSRLFVTKQHNGYELKRVYGLNLLLLSNFYPKSVFKKLVEDRRPICQVMYNAGIDIDLVVGKSIDLISVPFEGKMVYYDKNNAFSPVSHSRYHWTYALEYPEYYSEIKEIIDRDLVFPPIPNEKGRKLACEIDECNSVGIHIRLGDFEQLGWLTSPEYYRRCIKWCENNLHPDRYYIFSNEQDYCKRHKEEYGFNLIESRCDFVEGNRGENDYLDFQLMTLCKYVVVAPFSTFSQCACVFSKNVKTKIDGDTIGMKLEDYFGWKRT